ncbi:MAG: carboxypeptidase-like regulatory domain-containing protein, partial [Saprospiraceae bacterium]|nr:carboxypeptidase-like regulatory domain-containing protein [Saprospiraceae bacterium]
GYVSLVRTNGNPTGYRTFADGYGNFSFDQLAPGEYIIEVQGDRPSELGRRKVTLHPNKRIEAIITLRHSLEFGG